MWFGKLFCGFSYYLRFCNTGRQCSHNLRGKLVSLPLLVVHAVITETFDEFIFHVIYVVGLGTFNMMIPSITCVLMIGSPLATTSPYTDGGYFSS
jgi:hypothetical protein